MNPIVFIVDDDEAMRDSLGLLMTSVGLAYQTFASGPDFLAACGAEPSGCLVLDIRMPGMSGLDLQLKLKQQQLHLPIVFITGHGDVPMAVQAMKQGASDFFQKPFRDQELLDCIAKLLEQSQDQKTHQVERQDVLKRQSTLTAREREVLSLVVEGTVNKAIAVELNISTRTVELHRSHVMQKMQADSLAHLVHMTVLLLEPLPSAE